MKRLTAILAAIPAFVCAYAQTDVNDILRHIQDDRMVTLEYLVTVGTDIPVTYSGKACLQQGAFLLKGNGVEIYCDGETLVCVDPASREIYVEKACSIQDYVTNSIGSVKEYKFSNVSSTPRQEDLGQFKYDFRGKDSSWIVTDLR